MVRTENVFVYVFPAGSAEYVRIDTVLRDGKVSTTRLGIFPSESLAREAAAEGPYTLVEAPPEYRPAPPARKFGTPPARRASRR